MFILQRANPLFRSPSKGHIHTPTHRKIEAQLKLKPPTNIKEVRHFLGLTSYYRTFICNYSEITHPLNCLTHKSQPFMWTPEYQSSFDMLCSRLANAHIVQLPDPNKPCLLFTDASKYCYSSVLTQASTDKSNTAFLKLLTEKNPLKSIHPTNTGTSSKFCSPKSYRN